jgi:murein DD-endopeptidase MepM/ murein hydrolase activator NlpD
MPPLERPALKTAKFDEVPSEKIVDEKLADDKKKKMAAEGDVPCPKLIWPLSDGVVTQEFKLKKKRRRGHKGIDIGAPKGDAIFAAHDGLVVFAGRQFRGFGKLIIIENEEGNWATFYSHLHKIITKTGARVAQGDLIGKVGKTGRATGYHLHFEVRHNKEPVNPLTVLP